jgi:hypothetical protein
MDIIITYNTTPLPEPIWFVVDQYLALDPTPMKIEGKHYPFLPFTIRKSYQWYEDDPFNPHSNQVTLTDEIEVYDHIRQVVIAMPSARFIELNGFDLETMELKMFDREHRRATELKKRIENRHNKALLDKDKVLRGDRFRCSKCSTVHTQGYYEVVPLGVLNPNYNYLRDDALDYPESELDIPEDKNLFQPDRGLRKREYLCGGCMPDVNRLYNTISNSTYHGIDIIVDWASYLPQELSAVAHIIYGYLHDDHLSPPVMQFNHEHALTKYATNRMIECSICETITNKYNDDGVRECVYSCIRCNFDICRECINHNPTQIIINNQLFEPRYTFSIVKCCGVGCVKKIKNQVVYHSLADLERTILCQECVSTHNYKTSIWSDPITINESDVESDVEYDVESDGGAFGESDAGVFGSDLNFGPAVDYGGGSDLADDINDAITHIRNMILEPP